MRVLCVCDHGSNRSVHVADQLRYRGHEAIPAGAYTLSEDTLKLLVGWCDLAILTDPGQLDRLPDIGEYKVWPLPENPRPYNPATLTLVRGYIERSGL